MERMASISSLFQGDTRHPQRNPFKQKSYSKHHSRKGSVSEVYLKRGGGGREEKDSSYFAHTIGNMDQFLLAVVFNVRQGQHRDEWCMIRLLNSGSSGQESVKDRECINLVKQNVQPVLGCKLEELDDHFA